MQFRISFSHTQQTNSDDDLKPPLQPVRWQHMAAALPAELVTAVFSERENRALAMRATAILLVRQMPLRQAQLGRCPIAHP